MVNLEQLNKLKETQKDLQEFNFLQEQISKTTNKDYQLYLEECQNALIFRNELLYSIVKLTVDKYA